MAKSLCYKLYDCIYNCIYNWFTQNPGENSIGCVIVTPSKLFQGYSTNFKYYNNIRYYYFYNDDFIRDYLLNNKENIIIRIQKNNEDLARFEISLKNYELVNNIIGGQRVKEYKIDNNLKKNIIIRIPDKPRGGAHIIFIDTF